MQIEVDVVLVDLHGKPLSNGGAPFTLKDAILGALLAPLDDTKTTAQDKVARFNLAKRVAAGGKIALAVEDIAAIKSMVGKVYASPMVVGRAFELLEGEGAG